MDITLLKTFIEVARTLHFGKAAERLFVTQSAVSARIKLLEERVGRVLFERKRNAIRLTPAGERLLRHAEVMVRTWERARQDMAVDEEYGQTLQVGTNPDLWRLWVNEWAARVLDAESQLAFRFEVAPRDALADRLSTGSLDLAIVMEPPGRPGLVHRQVMTVALVLAASEPGLDYRSAAGRGYWYVDWGLSFAISHDALFADAEASRHSINSGDAALQFVLEHGGAAYLPRPWVERPMQDGRLHAVADAPEIERAGFAVWRPDSARASLIERLLQV